MLNLRTNKLRDFLKQSLKIVLMEVLNTKIKNSTLNRVNKKTIHQSNKNSMINLKQKQRKMLKNKAILC